MIVSNLVDARLHNCRCEVVPAKPQQQLVTGVIAVRVVDFQQLTADTVSHSWNHYLALHFIWCWYTAAVI